MLELIDIQSSNYMAIQLAKSQHILERMSLHRRRSFAPQVSVSYCPDLSVATLQKLITLELSEMPKALWQHLPAVLACCPRLEAFILKEKTHFSWYADDDELMGETTKNNLHEALMKLTKVSVSKLSISANKASNSCCNIITNWLNRSIRNDNSNWVALILQEQR